MKIRSEIKISILAHFTGNFQTKISDLPIISELNNQRKKEWKKRIS